MFHTGFALFVISVSSLAPVSASAEERAEETGLTVPAGFEVTIVADELGPARHVAARDNGDVYVILRSKHGGHGKVALRDASGDGRFDRVERFGDVSGTGIAVHEGFLYFSSTTAVHRQKLADGELVPQGEVELVAGGFPEQRAHAAKPLAFDGEGGLYVTSGAPSNACQRPIRTAGTAGREPCPELERSGGIWRFSADRTGQDQVSDGKRFATGVRHAVAIDWNPFVDALYIVQHGRDQLSEFWPEHFTDEDNARLPAEELHRLREGSNVGWPYTYWDPDLGKRMVAPEYGGDGETPSDDERFQDPLFSFPAHFAPNDLHFYRGEAFPERYRRGAFVAFHGSWNRAPLEQRGYKVTFLPFDEDGKPSGDYEVFADGFAGVEPIRSPGQAKHRPMGIAEGPRGELYVTDSVGGRLWRIRWTGETGESGT